MLQIANRLAETTPAIIDSKYLNSNRVLKSLFTEESRKKMAILEDVRKANDDKGLRRVLREIKEETDTRLDAQRAFLQANRKKQTGLTLNKDLGSYQTNMKDEGKSLNLTNNWRYTY